MQRFLPKGTQIAIRLHGQIYSGQVISANNYGSELQSNWYIEFDHDEKSAGRGYGYWKEGCDGGQLIKGAE